MSKSITKAEVEELGKNLRKVEGYQRFIARRCDCSTEYVRRFFYGDYNINEKNKQFIPIARKLIKSNEKLA